jgi:hypothetical protein
MAVHVHQHVPGEIEVDTSEVRYADSTAHDSIARVVGMVAAAVPTTIGLIALARINWDNGGLDAPAVSVAEMAFSPWLAIGTLVAGLLGLLAAASWDSDSKFGIGALFGCVGIAVLVANPEVQQVTMTDRMGWMHVIVGIALILAGMMVGQRWATTRTFRRHES